MKTHNERVIREFVLAPEWRLANMTALTGHPDAASLLADVAAGLRNPAAPDFAYWHQAWTWLMKHGFRHIPEKVAS